MPPPVSDAELRQALAVVFQASRRPEPYLLLELRDREPENPGDGMLALADGEVGGWDPGSGAGVYAYYGGAWNKLG